jgi:hypothetical protein
MGRPARQDRTSEALDRSKDRDRQQGRPPIGTRAF